MPSPHWLGLGLGLGLESPDLVHWSAATPRTRLFAGPCGGVVVRVRVRVSVSVRVRVRVKVKVN